MRTARARETLLEEIETRRNTLAHNVWFKADGPPLVQSLTGVWPRSGKEAKIKRRVQPAGIPITEAALADLIATQRKAIAQSRLLRGELARAVEAKGRAVPNAVE